MCSTKLREVVMFVMQCSIWSAVCIGISRFSLFAGGNFIFQAKLKNDGTITFVYKSVSQGLTLCQYNLQRFVISNILKKNGFALPQTTPNTSPPTPPLPPPFASKSKTKIKMPWFGQSTFVVFTLVSWSTASQ